MNFSKITPKFATEFTKAIKSSKVVYLTTHLSPDGDAIGSLCACSQLVNKLNPQATIKPLISGGIPSRFSQLADQFKLTSSDPASENYHLPSDCLICLDGSQYHRFSHQWGETTSLDSIKTVCLDHHASPTDHFDLLLIDHHAGSTSEIIFDLYQKLGLPLTADSAKALMLGIIEDSGHFNYVKPDQYAIFPKFRQLLDLTRVEIQDFMAPFQVIQRPAFDLVSHLITNTHFVDDIPGCPPFQYTYVDPAYTKKHPVSDEIHSEATHLYMSHYLRLVEGYKWGFTVYVDNQNRAKISLRSLPGSVNVRQLVESMAIGGGHDRASGGKIHDCPTPRIAINKLLKYLQHHEPQLS